jgi:glycerol-3-phosphate O-acyltransferase/dihydroxyacetone phosphate acyltransferase
VSLVGAALSFFVGSAVELFYRRRVLDGRIPETGPVLLVANHPNALLDPVLVMNSTRRRVRMLAKAPLFSMPGISILVKGLDCLPVYRAKDGADTAANAATFRSVEDALVGGSCVLIFPEGISHDEPGLQPLKTGAARMAIGAVRKGARDLVVVPVGLTYADKLRYRSTAAVDIGAPIRVADYVEDDGGDDADRDAARRLTDAIHAALLQETTNLRSWEDLRLLEATDAIWRQRDPERVRRIKSLADGVELLRREDPARLDDFRSRLSAWVDRVERLGLTPRDLGEEHLAAQQKPIRAAAFVARQVFALVVGLPLATIGAVFWAAPFWLVDAIWRLTGVEKDTGATVKVLASLVFFPLWWLVAVIGLAVADHGAFAIAAGALSPGLGLMTRHFFRRRAFALRQMLGVVRLASKGRLGVEVRAERDALCAELDAFGARVEALRAASPP